MIEEFAGAAVGFIAGRMVREVATRLPPHQFRKWRIEAGEILDTDVVERDDRPFSASQSMHALQRNFIPEVGCALLSASVVGMYGFTVVAVAMLALTWALFALALIDAEHQVLPDVIVLPMMWLGLTANQQGLFATLDDALYGAIAGYMVLWVMLNGFKLLTGREGMGSGDLKMLAMLGAWGGWQLLLLIIIVASTSASVYGITMKCFSRTECNPHLPFGPFLALGGFIAMMWGDMINTAYLG